MTIRKTLSPEGFNLLRHFAERGGAYHMPVAEARRYNQTQFRCALKRNYIAYRASGGFHLTKDGRDAWARWEVSNILRKDPTRPMTSLFDITQYRETPLAKGA